MFHPSRRHLASIALLAISSALLAFAATTYTGTAKLFGAGPLRGSATCTTRSGALGPYRVDVNVTHGQPAQTLEVSIDGNSVGQIITNSNGAGHLRINNITDALGSAGAGDTVTVDELTGVFFDGSVTALQRYDLQGSITDIVGVHYVVRYHELFTNDQLERRWEVTITNAEPNQSVPTFVRAAFIHPLLPDATGSAKLRMRTASFINASNNPAGWIALPNTFPSLEDGEVVQVGTSYITMHRTP